MTDARKYFDEGKDLGPYIHCHMNGICRMHCTSKCNSKRLMSDSDKAKWGHAIPAAVKAAKGVSQ